MFLSPKRIKKIDEYAVAILLPFVVLLFKDAGETFLSLLSAIFLLVGLVVVFFIHKQAINNEKRIVKELESYDYKMFFEIDNQNDFNTVANLFGPPSDILSSQNMMDEFTRCAWARDNKNLEQDVIDILNGNKLSTVHCRLISPKAKKGKCILQGMFVPLDKDNNTLLIKRLDEYHKSLFEDNLEQMTQDKTRKTEYCFISFSPLPDRFSQAFVPDDAYHREVKRSGYPYELAFQGLILRKLKRKSLEDLNTYYLMIVYAVKYVNDSFSTNSPVAMKESTDWETVKNIFACSDPAQCHHLSTKFRKSHFNTRSGDSFFFEKDHDEICQAISWEQLHQMTAPVTNDEESEKTIKEAEKAIIAHFRTRNAIEP